MACLPSTRGYVISQIREQSDTTFVYLLSRNWNKVRFQQTPWAMVLVCLGYLTLDTTTEAGLGSGSMGVSWPTQR